MSGRPVFAALCVGWAAGLVTGALVASYPAIRVPLVAAVGFLAAWSVLHARRATP